MCFGVVVQDLVVDLVGEQQQLVLAREIDHLLEDFAGVHRAGGVVRVDHHDRLGAVGDLRLQIGDVGLPALGLVAQVVHRRAAGQRRRRRPQRIVRGGNEHLVAVVQQRLQRHRDELGDAVAEIDVVDVESRKALDEFVAGEHRAAGAGDALGVGIALRVRQRLDHVAHDDVGRLEAERRGITDVQLEDPVTLGLESRRVIVHRAADLVQDVLQLRRLRERALPRMMSGGVQRHVVGGHVTHGLIAVQRLCKNAGQRLPGGRAPLAMPRPFTGGAGFSPLSSAEGSGAGLDSPSDAGSGCGAAAFGSCGAAAAFLAPGRRAPAAMPSPLTSGSGVAGWAGASGSGSGLAASASGAARLGAAAFLAPGRRAPAAIPRPLTSGSGLAGSAAAGVGGRRLSGVRRGGGLLGAGTLGAAGDAQTLGRRCGGCGLFGRLCGRFRRGGGLLGAGTLGATGDAQTLGRAVRRLRAFRPARPGRRSSWHPDASRRPRVPTR